MNNNIPICSTIQEKNEFIVTFPQAYHQGFNYGLNCAESVNFALKPWIKFGESMQSFCSCDARKSKWKFDMKQMLLALNGKPHSEIVKV